MKFLSEMFQNTNSEGIINTIKFNNATDALTYNFLGGITALFILILFFTIIITSLYLVAKVMHCIFMPGKPNKTDVKPLKKPLLILVSSSILLTLISYGYNTIQPTPEKGLPNYITKNTALVTRKETIYLAPKRDTKSTDMELGYTYNKQTGKLTCENEDSLALTKLIDRAYKDGILTNKNFYDTEFIRSGNEYDDAKYIFCVRDHVNKKKHIYELKNNYEITKTQKETRN